MSPHVCHLCLRSVHPGGRGNFRGPGRRNQRSGEMADLQITGMDHIVLNVADIDRSLGFYTDVLGLKPERVEQFKKGEVGFPSVRISEGTLIDLMEMNGPVLNEG